MPYTPWDWKWLGLAINFHQKEHCLQITEIIKERKINDITINDRNIYVNEHFLKVGAELKNEANEQGFIFLTKNCKISVLVLTVNNTIGYHRIIDTIDFFNVPNAIKREDAIKKRKLEKDNDGKSICSPDMKRVNQQ